MRFVREEKPVQNEYKLNIIKKFGDNEEKKKRTKYEKNKIKYIAEQWIGKKLFANAVSIV